MKKPADCDPADSHSWCPSPLLAFLLLAVVRIVSALTNPIADCDETFNYWEVIANQH